MWLQDLEKALAKLREERPDFKLLCVDSITPCWDGGIVFKTTYHTYIKVCRNGVITERKEKDWKK